MDICAYIHIIMLDSKVKFFKALGDKTRLTILSYLLEHSYCACDFSSLTKKDQTTVSKHLKVLVEAGILKYEKQGRNIIYSIKNKEIEDLLLSLGIRDIKPCCDKQQVSGVCPMCKTEVSGVYPMCKTEVSGVYPMCKTENRANNAINETADNQVEKQI